MKLNIIIGLLSCTKICQGLLNSNGHKQRQRQQQQRPVQSDLISSPQTNKKYSQEKPKDVSRLFADIIQDAERLGTSASLILDEIVDEFHYKEFKYVISLLQRIYNNNQEEEGTLSKIDSDDYAIVFQEIAKIRNKSAPDLADKVLRLMMKLGETNDSLLPTAQIFETVISIWSHSFQKNAGLRCCEYLDLLWSIFSSQKEESKFLPTQSMYVSTIIALSKIRRREGAEKAEQVLKEMMMLEEQYPELSPDTACINGVLNAWSKSGVRRGAATRCEQILNKMISDYKAGRTQLQPNTTSFNIVMDALAKSNEEDAELRAEAWLHKMEDVASMDESLSMCCKPDKVSFNIVLNCWAQSKSRIGAKRATSILKHMEQRYNTNNSDIHPDAASYATVINAWSRSRESNAVKRAEEVMKRAEEAQEHNHLVELNALTYNSMINCYAKSNNREAADRALDILDMLKARCFDDGERRYHPDVVTYTSVIDSLAKQATYTASKKAETLLNELETAFEATGDIRFKPNIRTYTSTVNAIGRSRKEPERAEGILKRILVKHEMGDSILKADVVFFNALINAYGWSTVKGKAAKCYEILNMMFDLNESGQNDEAKPDIVTCNSVLNACAFERGCSRADRGSIIDIVVNTLETFQSAAPLHGSPDHVTYAQVLLAISKHMAMDETRIKLAETTFYQCCESGQVSTMVLSNLKLALPWERFASLLGPALLSSKGSKLTFDRNKLPESWIRFTMSTFARRRSQKSRPSHKRPNGYVTRKRY